MDIKIYKSEDDILAIYFTTHSSKYRFFNTDTKISEINKIKSINWATARNGILKDCINYNGYRLINPSPISQIKVVR